MTMISKVQSLYSEACAQVSDFAQRKPKTAKAVATALAVGGLALAYSLSLGPVPLKEIFSRNKTRFSSVEYLCDKDTVFDSLNPLKALYSNHYCREKLTLVSDSHKMVCLLPPQGEGNVKTLFKELGGYVSERFISVMKAQENPRFCSFVR